VAVPPRSAIRPHTDSRTPSDPRPMLRQRMNLAPKRSVVRASWGVYDISF
jgi:hypothetical protein